MDVPRDLQQNQDGENNKSGRSTRRPRKNGNRKRIGKSVRPIGHESDRCNLMDPKIVGSGPNLEQRRIGRVSPKMEPRSKNPRMIERTQAKPKTSAVACDKLDEVTLWPGKVS